MRSMILAVAALAFLFGAGLAHGKDKAIDEPHPATNLKFRLIGPSYPSGRISEIIVHPSKNAHWFVSTASGGVWETRNAGTTWSPLFDRYSSYAVGAMAMDPNDPMTLWVGTGENNAQRSVAKGDGVYVSHDGGKTFSNVGLKESGHISQIWIDPSDSDTVLVAAQGPLWSDGGDRGLYKTTDGGKNWQAILTVDDYTGVNEFVVHPDNPDVMIASTYQRRRHVWTLINGGPGSGIHRTTDGGKTWQRVSRGLPKDTMGRIGLAGAASKPSRLFAIIEAMESEKGVYLSDDFGQSWQKRSGHMTTSPQYYNEIYVDPKNPDRLYSLDTFAKVSEDAGKTFQNIGNKNRHVDDHALVIDPQDTDHLIIGGDGGVYESWDRGATWRHFENLPIVQFYRIQPDNAYPFYNVCGGTQDNNSLCGPSRTSNIHGITNADWLTILGGDGYEAVIDPEDPNIIYTQYQYGGLARYDRRTQERVFIAPVAPQGENRYKFNWNTPIIISPHNRTRLYYAAEKLFRSNDRGDSWTVVSPDLTRQLDRNALDVMGRLWSDNAIAKNDSTSIYGSVIGLSESPLQEGLIYIGSDDGLIHVTENGGADWRTVDSFKGVPDMSLIEDVHASAHDVDVAYAIVDNHKRGDFKPYILKTKDKGKRWTLISNNLPEGPVHTITEDPVDPDLLFVGTEVGVFVSQNGGESWTRMKNGLPTVAIRDLEIQAREGDLVVGTFGRGIYVLDDIAALRTPADRLEKADATIFPVRDALQYIPGDLWGGRPNNHHGAQWWRVENPPFGAVIRYHLSKGYQTLAKKRRMAEQKAEKEGKDTPYPDWDSLRKEDEEEAPTVMATIRDANGQVVRRLKAATSKGLHELVWDLRYEAPGIARLKEPKAGPFGPPPRGPMALPGTYEIALSVRVGGVMTALGEPEQFTVKVMDFSPDEVGDRADILAFQMRTTKLINAVRGAGEVLKDVEKHSRYLAGALKAAPAATEAMETELRAINATAKTLRTVLYGDRTISSRNEPAPVSLAARSNRLIFMGWGSQAAIGGQQRSILAAAEADFGTFLPKLKALKQSLKTLEAQASEIDAPWSPGRMPTWP